MAKIISVALRLFRFLLYCFAIIAGVAGLLTAGVPLLKYAFERLDGRDFDVYLVMSPSDRFSSEIILILSLLLLIAAHIGHVLAGGLRLKNAASPMLPESQAEKPPQNRLKPSDFPTEANPAPAEVNVITPDEKLAHLVRSPADKSDS